MTYRSGKSKKTREYVNLALGLVAFSLFIYFWAEFRSIVYPAVEPFVRGYGGTKKGATVMPEFISSYFSARNELTQKNNDLELNVERLENTLAEREAFIREQFLVKDTAGIDTTAPVVIMYPLVQDITKLYSTILLSKGFKDGIEKESLVYIRGLQPVCEISEVHDHTSLCELLSKGGRETEGVTASSSVNLVLTGMGGGNFVTEIPKDTSVFVGEAVYLKSNPAYKVGTIISVQDDKQATGAVVYVRGAYNPVSSSVYYMNARYVP